MTSNLNVECKLQWDFFNTIKAKAVYLPFSLIFQVAVENIIFPLQYIMICKIKIS